MVDTSLYANIPDELKKLNQWVCWRHENNTKVLKVAAGKCGRNAKTNDKSTWRSFATAAKQSKYADGIGFVFTVNDPYIGIDMDNKQGIAELDADHQVWIKAFDSYTERSPSGKGYHVILKGEQIKGFNQSPYEAYSTGRFFAFTGDVVLVKPIIAGGRALAEFISTFGVSERDNFTMPEAVEVGNRNDTLFRLACSMLTRGMDREDVVMLITGFNRGLEKPLPASEVKQLLNSAGSYESAKEITINMYEWLLDNLVWVAGQNAYWDHSQRGLLAVESVNRAYYKEMPETEDADRVPPASFLMASENQKVVYDLGWHPSEGEIYDWEGQTRINTYTPSELIPIKGTPSPWVRHLKWLVPNEMVREQVLNWLAFTVQRPGEKINYGLFLGGTERIGKDMLLQPIVKILGEHNCKEIGAGDLHEQWTDYVFQTKLLIVGEMHTKLHQQRVVENHLKRLLAGTATSSLVVNDKNVKKFKIPNLINVVFMSNHKDALVITGENAARYLCWWCPVKRRDDDYYNKFGAWLDDVENQQAVYHFLQERDLSKFNPRGNALETDFAREIVEVSRDALEMEIALNIEDHMPPFNRNLVTTDDICVSMELPIIRYRMKVNKVMAKLGYQANKVVGEYDGSLFKRSIYIVRGAQMYKEFSDSELLRQYMKQNKM